MIGYLQGTIRTVEDASLIVVCGGVGYRVHVTSAVLHRTSVGETLELFVHQHVREDGNELYGFLEHDELELFEQILGVSGVGPRLGLALLGLSAVPKLRAAIVAADVGHLTKVSGIGTKTAERIIVDLREKLGGRSGSLPPLRDEDIDAVDVLTRLGYTQKEARDALRHIADDVTGVEARVRAALSGIGRMKR